VIPSDLISVNALTAQFFYNDNCTEHFNLSRLPNRDEMLFALPAPASPSPGSCSFQGKLSCLDRTAEPDELESLKSRSKAFQGELTVLMGAKQS
jgi:hypothetical protein